MLCDAFPGGLTAPHLMSSLPPATSFAGLKGRIGRSARVTAAASALPPGAILWTRCVLVGRHGLVLKK